MAAIEHVTATILDSRDLIHVVVSVIDSDGVEGIGESWWESRTAASRAGAREVRGVAAATVDWQAGQSEFNTKIAALAAADG